MIFGQLASSAALFAKFRAGIACEQALGGMDSFSD